jgi:integrase
LLNRAVHEAESKVNFDLFAREVIETLPVRDKTRVNYRSVYRCHIEPFLGIQVLELIHRPQIQLMLLNLPPQTALMVLALTKSIFREAIEREIVEFSPADRVKTPPKIISHRRFLTWQDLDKIDFGKYNIQVRFLALHGLRWSEAMVLTEGDFRDGRVWVSKSIHGATKSQSGVRSVPHVSPFEPLPATPKPLLRVLKPYGVNIHSLRHTYAYILKSQNVHVTTAQKLLGHSDPKVTLAIYTQVIDSEIDDVGVLLRKLA